MVNVIKSITRTQKVLKFGVIVSTIVFAILLVTIYIWQINAPNTIPAELVYIFIAVTFLPYVFAMIYFVNKSITKICTKKEKQT